MTSSNNLRSNHVITNSIKLNYFLQTRNGTVDFENNFCNLHSFIGASNLIVRLKYN